MPRPERRSPRLAKFDYSHAGAYFVTVCSAGRRCIFGDVVDERMRLSALGDVVQTAWHDAARHWTGVAVDAFVVMPNHIHGIVWLTRAGQAPPLPAVVGGFKSAVSRLAGQRVWQRSFHDRVIRGDAELETFRRYIDDNPARWAGDRENPDRRRQHRGHVA